MRLYSLAPACVYLALAWPFFGQAQEWTEERIIEKFLDQSPYAREASIDHDRTDTELSCTLYDARESDGSKRDPRTGAP